MRRDGRGIEERLCQRRRSGEELGTPLSRRGREQRLEELPHDAEGEVPFELAAAGGDHSDSLACANTRLGEESRLADPRGALDHGEAPFPALGGSGQRREDRELVVALEQIQLGPRLGHCLR